MFLRPAVWESTYPAFSLFQLGFCPCKSKSSWYIQKLFWMKAKQSSGRQGGGHRSRGESVLKLTKLKLQGLSLTWVPPWSWMQFTFICFAKYFRDALTAIIKTTSVHFNSPSIIKSSLSPTLTLSWAIFCLKNNYGKINLRIHLQCVEWDLWHPVISLSLWNGGLGKGFQERSHCLDSPSTGTRRYLPPGSSTTAWLCPTLLAASNMWGLEEKRVGKCTEPKVGLLKNSFSHQMCVEL